MNVSTNFSIVTSALLLLCACTISSTSPQDAEVAVDVVIVDDGGISSDVNTNEVSMDRSIETSFVFTSLLMPPSSTITTSTATSAS